MHGHSLVELPAGVFPMGTAEAELDVIASSQHYARCWFEDESPQHHVAVSSFRLDRYPVTNRQYAEFTEATGYSTYAEKRGFGLVYGSAFWVETEEASWRTPLGPIGPCWRDLADHPVVHIAFPDAEAYARWAGLRLATEAEWEYAAASPAGHTWPWGSTWDSALANTAERTSDGPITCMADWQAWWAQFRSSRTLPGTTAVGSLPASDSMFGISDMAGQVMEWTGSRYDRYDPARTYDLGYERVREAGYQVMRGGGWMNYRFQTRTHERMAADQQYSSFATGFRCAGDL
jgi:sulfatase modifying factor 1